MPAGFNDACSAFFRKHFDLFDRDKIGRARNEDFATLIRACGATPLEASIEDLIAIADPSHRGSFSFDDFCAALKKAFAVSISPQEVREAFQGFDPDKRGLITPHELRYFLTTLGDVLSAEEMNEFVEEMHSEMDIEGNLVVADSIYKMTPEMLR
ncbi:calmodulin-like protein [Leishmania donovani]|uniref:Calmodulin-like protein n=1 Tax=Leishmania donovani TaxID=5661 RepID=A0A3S7X1A1_LEIDO|nr:calmodulin-like protein [Leishmania donovani]AYU80236.1 calmodulin-like protein [Leishmania donovani]TPP40550.1 EF-hand domain family protein [Leishmania donovani]TPP54229.1 EF-hand domain family protein [Leishmania donovani]CAJ1990225.1 calmodulin-like protein [Leishmania donovani]CBZ35491.1 calmodulin-like protein [Leishmania donovani]